MDFTLTFCTNENATLLVKITLKKIFNRIFHKKIMRNILLDILLEIGSDAPIWKFTDIPITDILGPILADTDIHASLQA